LTILISENYLGSNRRTPSFKPFELFTVSVHPPYKYNVLTPTVLYSGRVVPWTAITGSELSSLMVTTTDIIRRNMPDTISLDKSL
jgi:hypothetical protein